jgi:NAD(P)-dependent dehydrogenase (short-subunit alcohol dehydrogenase family)
MHYGSRIADYVDKHANAIANDIRDAIDKSSWIPDSFKPPHSGGGAAQLFARAPPPPRGIWQKTVAFMSRRRTTIAVVVAFTGMTVYLVHRRRKAHTRKRRAKKQSNGAKKEIVVLACSTLHDALTRSLALDLERRGYVVYVTVSSTDEDSLVQQEAKPDLRPLWIDLTSTVPNPAVDVHPNLEPIRELLSRSSPGSSSPSTSIRGKPSGNTLSNMTLAGLIVFPGCSGYSEGPLALLPPSDIIDTINTRLVSPLLTVQQFLPLMANHSTDAKSPSSIIIAYPSIPNSLSPPRQIPECIVTTSLSAIASSLRREISAAQANITITELKLGNFDMGSLSPSPWARTTPTQSTLYQGSSSALITTDRSQHWHSSQRAAHTRRTLGSHAPFIRSSSAREFHNAIFDALSPPQIFRPFGIQALEFSSRRKHNVVFVGTGARVYDVVGKYFPSGFVGLLMGWNRLKTRIAPPRPQADEENVVRSAYQDKAPLRSSVDALSTSAGSAAGPTSSTWGFQSIGSESGIWEKV